MRRFVQRLALVAALGLSAHTGVAHAVNYTFGWLAAGDGASTSALGLNNLGDVVGRVGDDDLHHPAVWRSGVYSPLSVFSNKGYIYDQGEASGINDAGQIVGTVVSDDDNVGRALMWDGGLQVDLHAKLVAAGGPSVPGSHALAINQGGEVVGQAFPLPRYFPVLWGGTVVKDLTWLAWTPSELTKASAINNVGQIAGTASTPSSAAAHAILWTNGVPKALGELGGGKSYAYGINDVGQVVGASLLQGNEVLHAALWTAGEAAIDLGTLGGTDSQANDINGKGKIVGWAKTASGESHAALWEGGVVIDLNTLLDPAMRAEGWSLIEATAINEDGWIVGNGQHDGLQQGFMLRPKAVPEASTAFMMLAGLLALAGASRRRNTSMV